jgi:hypothetical protein
MMQDVNSKVKMETLKKATSQFTTSHSSGLNMCHQRMEPYPGRTRSRTSLMAHVLYPIIMHMEPISGELE